LLSSNPCGTDALKALCASQSGRLDVRTGLDGAGPLWETYPFATLFGLRQLGGHAEANLARVSERQRYTSFTFLSGRLRIGLLVAAKMALSTAGATTQMVGSPTPPQKS
jgi:hypothetical protein